MKRMIACLLAACLALQMTIGFAETSRQHKIDALYTALGLPELVEILRIEGISDGSDIAARVLADRGNDKWRAVVASIYDPVFMTQELRAGFDEELRDSDLDTMLAFFTTQPGKSIVSLEISARRALLDDAVEGAARDAVAEARRDLTRRFQSVAEFIAANDLIALNVAGALDANHAFYLGLIDGGALPRNMTPDSMRQMVWAEEPMIRAKTALWLESYLFLAWQPLSDDDVATYLAFTRSAAGQELTAALGVAFDGLFSDVSRSLGLAAARFLVSQDL